MNEVNIEVGNGPVTTSGKWTQLIAGLSSVSTLLVTLSGSLPEGINPVWGLVLALLIGLVGVVSNFLVGLNRGQFAQAKAQVMASGQEDQELEGLIAQLQNGEPFTNEYPTGVEEGPQPPQ